jgi:hypothetical protein
MWPAKGETGRDVCLRLSGSHGRDGEKACRSKYIRAVSKERLAIAGDAGDRLMECREKITSKELCQIRTSG